MAWSPFTVFRSFQENDWAELEPARSFLVQNMRPATVVRSTASSVVCGTSLRFINQQSIMRSSETDQLAERLRRHKVTHVTGT